MSMENTRRVYVIASAAPPVLHLADLITALRDYGWESCVIATPTAASWIEIDALAQQTGFPVRVHARHPNEQDPLPPADAIVAAPITFNTLNKWAAGISDTLAAGLLNEALGLGLPVIAAPVIKSTLRTHPAYSTSNTILRTAGVVMLDPDAIAVMLPNGSLTLDWQQVVKVLAT